uniref:Uncharacterized protein n=1 Tax=Cacopsylla melanoneura TaxID=428564 RepID=A0A8D9ANN2_9HEMI
MIADFALTNPHKRLLCTYITLPLTKRKYYPSLKNMISRYLDLQVLSNCIDSFYCIRCCDLCFINCVNVCFICDNAKLWHYTNQVCSICDNSSIPSYYTSYIERWDYSVARRTIFLHYLAWK